MSNHDKSDQPSSEQMAAATLRFLGQMREADFRERGLIGDETPSTDNRAIEILGDLVDQMDREIASVTRRARIEIGQLADYAQSAKQILTENSAADGLFAIRTLAHHVGVLERLGEAHSRHQATRDHAWRLPCAEAAHLLEQGGAED